VTKKTKIVLIILIAAVFNALATVLCFAVLLLFYGTLLVPHVPKGIALAGTFVLLAAAMVLSFLLYRRILKVYLKKKPVFWEEPEDQ
jgi:membrane protein implicated in regulation of membrane protease activity